MTDPWRRGTDPILRLLRSITLLTVLGVFTYLAVDPDRTVDDVPTIALAAAMVMVLLGYAALIRLPIIGRPPPGRREDDDDDPAS